MPYVISEKRQPLNKLVKHIISLNPETYADFYCILYGFCEQHIEPGYNNYKNYCGELTQCANEIHRRFLSHIEGCCENNNELVFETPSEPNDIFYNVINKMRDMNIKADGDLNYILFKLSRCLYGNESQGYINFVNMLEAIVGSIELRLLGPYEEQKLRFNGDVF